MQACLFETKSPDFDDSLVDRRYFYRDTNQHAHHTCGMAFQTLLVRYRKEAFRLMNDSLWTPTLSSPPNQNPVVRGCLAEQACLTAIRRHGLGMVNARLSGWCEVKYFYQTPVWPALVESAFDLFLLIPSSFNYPGIDAAMVLFDREFKRAYIYPIQIAIALHKDSESHFYQEQWATWKAGLVYEGFSVDPNFILVKDSASRVRKRKAVTRGTRGSSKEVSPAYTFRVVSFKTLAPNVYDWLHW